MIRVLAIVLTVWTALRWLGVLAGLVRVRRFDGAIRREARRAVVVRACVTVYVSVAALYAWAQTERLQPADDFVGFIAAVLMGALVIGVAIAFMQPQERTPETIDLCRLYRRGNPARRQPETPPAST